MGGGILEFWFACGPWLVDQSPLIAPTFFIYIRPATTFPEQKVFALFYIIIPPMFNPLIYTLRNAEMKNALRKVWC